MRPLPPLELEAWRGTRATLQAHARLLGALRRALAPPEPHWWHVSLEPVAEGLRSAWLPLTPELAFESTIDLEAHRLRVSTSDGRGWALPLDGPAAPRLASDLLDLLASLGRRPTLDLPARDGNEPWDYDRLAAGAWWQAVRAMTGVFAAFSAELPGRSSPIQLWPHHFDLALTWFSGRRAPGVDPDDAEMAEEQMTFGFSTGDATIAEAYLYANAYPWPEGLTEARLPAPASWFEGAWTGSLLRYAALREASDPLDRLLTVLRAAHTAGAERMQD